MESAEEDGPEDSATTMEASAGVRIIYNASDGLETTMEAAGAIGRARGIYDKDRSVGGGR